MEPSPFSKSRSTRWMRCDRSSRRGLGCYTLTVCPVDTVQSFVRTLFNGWTGGARLHLASGLGCNFGCVGDSDCGLHCWIHCTRLRRCSRLSGETCLSRRAAATYTACTEAWGVGTPITQAAWRENFGAAKLACPLS